MKARICWGIPALRVFLGLTERGKRKAKMARVEKYARRIGKAYVTILCVEKCLKGKKR